MNVIVDDLTKSVFTVMAVVLFVLGVSSHYLWVRQLWWEKSAK